MSSIVEIAEMVDRDIYDVGVHPIIEFTEVEVNRMNRIAFQRYETGYTNTEFDHNTDFDSAADSKTSLEQHEKGLVGEAAVAKHHTGSLDALDESVTRTGDDGIDFELSTDGGEWVIDAKATNFGYDAQRTPLLKAKREKHERNLERVRSDEGADTRAYYLVERIDAHTARLIGYITVEAFDDVAELVSEDEEYTPTADSRPFVSHADNLVAEPRDLWLSYTD